jgi:type I restriction enzyme R subunit
VDSDELRLVEQPALDQLQGLGWRYIDGRSLVPELSEERTSLKEVVLEKTLLNSLRRINEWISEENLSKVIRDLTRTQYTNLLEANQKNWELLIQYISVSQDLGSGLRSQTVKIIDFENIDNNDFHCVNQFKVSGPTQNIIPDIILFVNGLPLAVIECKSPFITNPMEEGINQLLRYANRRGSESGEGAERLFHFNQMMVSTHRDSARVGTISSKAEHFLEWKDPYPHKLDATANSQQILIAGLFACRNFLDLIQNFTIFETDKSRVVKKIARYQQYRAVHKTIERLKSGVDKKHRGGVIWHTQGSGKSLTMVFLALKLRRDSVLRDHKLVFVTDRTQLDEQITGTFRRTQGETVLNATSVAHLKDLLARDSSDLVTAMIQKFQDKSGLDEFPILNESSKIVLLVDEGHRTQLGSLGSAINAGLPNAAKIAFTGTPLVKNDRWSYEFGSYIDTYTIDQSVKDGATVQILYEGREASVKVTGDSLDSLFNEYFADRTTEEQSEIKRRYGTQHAILEAPQRIRRVCLDIIRHYNEYIRPNGFKAMIVTNSRSAAITYKEMLDEEEGPECAVIISGDHNDDERTRKYTDILEHKKAIENFQKPFGFGEGESNLAVLIVKDMLLTGFDAPIAQVMYLDRKLTDHTLLQAIARVNRTSANKHRGFIVDYFGLSDYLTEALEMFTSADVSGALKNTHDEMPKLQQAHQEAISHFAGLDLSDTDACILRLKDETKRQDFFVDYQIFARQMEIVLPSSAANPFLRDLRRLGKIVHGVRNTYRDPTVDITGVGEKVRKLIADHIYSTGVDPKIPPVDLLDPKFREKVNSGRSSQVRAVEIETAIQVHIKIESENDPEYYLSLSKRLEEIIKACEEKWDELAQMLLVFRDEIEDRRKQLARGLGLSETEYSFYGILMAEVTKTQGETITEEINQKVIALVRTLVAYMQEVTAIVDFFNKWDEVKTMRRKIKRTIDDSLSSVVGDIEEVNKAITERFLDLAKHRFK